MNCPQKVIKILFGGSYEKGILLFGLNLDQAVITVRETKCFANLSKRGRAIGQHSLRAYAPTHTLTNIKSQKNATQLLYNLCSV